MDSIPKRMHAMEFAGVHQPLHPTERPIRKPTGRNLLIRVGACGICRTDLHVIDGDLEHPKAHVIPGHEVVGRVVAMGPEARGFKIGERVGVPWLGFTCGRCHFCRSGRENLCDKPRFTGYTLDGGYAEYITADSHYSFPIPKIYSDAEAAPLMCAGLIGYRCWKLVRTAKRLGIYGFGAAAHIVAQIAKHHGQQVYAFTRSGDVAAQKLARSLGAVWAGSSEEMPPKLLDAAIIFASVGPLVPLALKALEKGGTLVLGGIHMSEIPAFSYDLLWEERIVRSVANLTRQDAIEFLKLAPRVPIRPHVTTYPLDEANEAIAALRKGNLVGAAVLVPSAREGD
ncbi:zinc-dependent alcohol dehydrogenase family protein [Hyphomicrobium sp. NDB2Meth4]|uniref:zinc-dependent alcohol dehydrogenase family protein n=1 Tax=Hyphomicrobium sp. NDB2Meth4 TaxID=1892846 RepID=UPI000A3FFDDA|nr:zinc-dependent alcohol dehydrogenase family protein [Hyphomicrobium sp. NDB2Meth4]